MSGSTRALLPVGHTQKTSKGRHPGSILIRCTNHLSWLLSTHRSIGAPLCMSELLTPSLRLSPETLQRKYFKTFCIHNLIISVTIQSSWPQVRVITYKSKALSFSSASSSQQCPCYCWCYTNLPYNLTLHFTIMHKQDPKLLNLLHSFRAANTSPF